MRKHGLRLGYLGPRTGSAARRQDGLVSAAGADHGVPRPVPAAVARARAAGRRVIRAWLNAQIRVAGPPWDGGSFAPVWSAAAPRVAGTGAATETSGEIAR